MRKDRQAAVAPRAAPPAEVILEALDAILLVSDLHGVVSYRSARARSCLAAGDTLQAVFRGARTLEPFAGWESELTPVVREGAPRRLDLFVPSTTEVGELFSLRLTRLTAAPPSEQAMVLISAQRREVDTALGDQLEVSQRLASLGKLAARIAHELSNPLDGILRYINLALRVAGEAPPSKLTAYLAESRTGLLRMMQIIDDLLEFSRSSGAELGDLSVNQIVEQAVQQTTAAADITRMVVALDLQTQHMPLVRGSRLFQICRNLIKNAIDAMPDGGRLTVTTGLVDNQVVIRVADTGIGLPEQAGRIFEPFFTTKPPGKGTGLGLAICKDFVEDMQGTITAERGEERGAVFTVRIPTSAFSSWSQPGPPPAAQEP